MRKCNFNLLRNALGFSHHLTNIREEHKRLAPAGHMVSGCINWQLPVSSNEEAQEVAKSVRELHSKGLENPAGII